MTALQRSGQKHTCPQRCTAHPRGAAVTVKALCLPEGMQDILGCRAPRDHPVMPWRDRRMDSSLSAISRRQSLRVNLSASSPRKLQNSCTARTPLPALTIVSTCSMRDHSQSFCMHLTSPDGTPNTVKDRLKVTWACSNSPKQQLILSRKCWEGRS
jgi:hypothetical protein